jgi:hypothetical protein
MFDEAIAYIVCTHCLRPPAASATRTELKSRGRDCFTRLNEPTEHGSATSLPEFARMFSRPEGDNEDHEGG